MCFAAHFLLQEVDDAAAAGPFEDEETRAFYESLPDLRAVVPAVLLGDKAPEEPANGVAADITADTADQAQAQDQSADTISSGQLCVAVMLQLVVNKLTGSLRQHCPVQSSQTLAPPRAHQYHAAHTRVY